MDWLVDLVMRLVGFFLKRPAPTPPETQEAVQAASAATAQTELAQATQGQAVQSAVAQAEVQAPKDTAGVVTALDQGTF